MKMPTDIVSVIIFLIDAGIWLITIDEAIKRLRSGISATAQKEGRDVTPEENVIIKSLEDESDRRRRGG